MAAWLLGLVAAAACGLLAWTLLGEPMSIPATAPATLSTAAVAVRPRVPATPAAEVAAAKPAAPVLPSFDIVRVDPQGGMVLAGRAQPGRSVVVSDNGRPIAQVQPDARGQWVALPAPLAAGGHQLTVAPAALALAGPSMRSAPVIVLVPERGAPSGPLALLVPDKGMPRLLQPPLPPPAPQGQLAQLVPSARGGPALGLGIVDYDQAGAIRFGGTAPAGSLVRVYVDRALAGDAQADALGRWTLQPAGEVAAGRHQLRIDQLADAGAGVSARVALPFERVLLPAGLVRDGHMVVQPGQSLWRIARRVYGHGVRYTVIYLANRSQIRNPSLIYPGQVFAVPPLTPPAGAAASAKPNPAAASASR